MKKSTKVAIAYVTAVALASQSNAKQKGKITECPTSSEDRKIFFVFFLIAFIIWGIIFLFRYLSNDWEEVRGTFFMVSSIVALFFIHLLPE